MFIIGIDPHRGSHAAVVIDRTATIQATLELPANRHQRQRLLDWASGYTPRAWAVEGATGTGSLLAQQLVAAGERVIDVPPKLAQIRVGEDAARHRPGRRWTAGGVDHLADEQRVGAQVLSLSDLVTGAMPWLFEPAKPSSSRLPCL